MFHENKRAYIQYEAFFKKCIIMMFLDTLNVNFIQPLTFSP